MRDLAKKAFGKDPDIWDYIDENGRSIYQIIKQNKSILETSSPTSYLKVALRYPFISILTCQPPDWILYTEKWIKKHLSSVSYDITYLSHQEEKLKVIGYNYLIDDYPKFSSYNNIILIDKPYNRNIKVPIRVENSNKLEKIIDIITGEKI